jgi:hypothetical protein
MDFAALHPGYKQRRLLKLSFRCRQVQQVFAIVPCHVFRIGGDGGTANRALTHP